jgi:hypothetical protein
MGGVDIQAKVKSGLAKAVNAVGSGDLVYLVKETKSGGTPLNPPTVATENILLTNAIFKAIKITQFSSSLIQQGDRQLIASADVELNINDKIEQGSRKMYIVDVGPSEPAGVVLVYKCVVRDM